MAHSIRLLQNMALFVGLTAIGSQLSAQMAPPAGLQTPCGSTTYQYSRLKVMAAIKTPSSQPLTLVAAHRGYWEDYPENSFNAILAAGYCYEIVEADLKPSLGDDVAVEHDLELDRTTTLHGPLNAVSIADFQASFLRDRHGIVTTQHPMNGTALLALYQNYVETSGDFGGFVLALDVKAKDTVNAPWPLLQVFHNQLRAVSTSTNQLANSVLYKIEAKALPADPNTVQTYINSGPAVPLNLYIVYNPTDPTDAAVMRNYAGKSFVAGSEVNYPYVGSPMQTFVDDLQPVGTFATYYDLAEGVGTAKALCCGTVNTDTTQTKAIDYRGRYDYYALMKSSINPNAYLFNLITIDRPDIMVPLLQAAGLHNTTNILK